MRDDRRTYRKREKHPAHRSFDRGFDDPARQHGYGEAD
jgi:hypothetical protein